MPLALPPSAGDLDGALGLDAGLDDLLDLEECWAEASDWDASESESEAEAGCDSESAFKQQVFQQRELHFVDA